MQLAGGGGGEQVVVLDNGAGTIKIGWAGDADPTRCVCTCVCVCVCACIGCATGSVAQGSEGAERRPQKYKS